MKFEIRFDNSSIMPKEQWKIVAAVGRTFRAKEFFVGTTEGFLIDDIIIDGVSALQGMGPLPAVIFGANAKIHSIAPLTAKEGKDIVLIVTNESDTTKPFNARLEGYGV